MEIKAAFQGEPGAYSEAAAFEYFGNQIEVLPCEQFENVFSQISQGKATHGMLPIENSLAGSIHRNYDLMLRHDLSIVGEHNFRVSHCLMALPGVKIEEIKRVHSHPQALAQCEKSLAELGVKRVAETDTAGSARLIKEAKDTKAGALASSRAAQVYGLSILKEHMEDNPSNFTRFLALTAAPPEESPAPGKEYKTSIVFSLVNKPGVLFKAISVFALRDIDLTKIESRPHPEKTWDYLFYIDFAGHAAEENCARALSHLGEIAPFLRVLGSYPRHRLG
ncbi:MAG: prephenate dehydratase [Anaerolineae bacterium]|nr:prephenate dehydratase [Anaerolineae bacterium]